MAIIHIAVCNYSGIKIYDLILNKSQSRKRKQMETLQL